MSETVDIRLLGEHVRRLQEQLRGLQVTLDALGPGLAAQFQAGLQQTGQVLGQHLAVMDRRIDNLVNVAREQSETLGRIEAKLDALARPA
jgi:hypothetical protein